MTINYFRKTATNILENQELREPQIAAYVETYSHFITEKKKTQAIIVLPTGAGKSGLISILPFNIANGRVLIITPQLTIRDSIENTLNPLESNNFLSNRNVIENPNNLPAISIFKSKETRKSQLDDSNIVITNIQQLQKRNDNSLLNLCEKNYFDMIIIDEGHHSEARTWVDTINHFDEAKIVKLTATPFRSDKLKLTGELVYKFKLSQAMADRYVKSLEKFNYIPEKLYLYKENDETPYTVDEVLNDPDYNEDWVARTVSFSEECKNQVIDKSIELLNEKKAGSSVPHKIIASAPNVSEAIQIAELYSSRDGINAIAVYHDMQNREQAFIDIDNHRYNVIVNVNLLGEGYDHKYLSVAAIFRVYKNILPYEQFIGRILRTIPEEEVSKAQDNIGSVVVHENLNLDELWNYYKEQIHESDILNNLKDDLTDYDDDETGKKEKSGVVLNVEFGKAKEVGKGSLKKEIYTTTEYIQEYEEEKKVRKDKITQIMNILGVSENQAAGIVDSEDDADPLLKRPDLLYNHRRKTTNENIQAFIVPELLREHNYDPKNSDLSTLPIFTGKYKWITKMENNAAMLAVYFNTYLKHRLGKARDAWENDDFEFASELLDEQKDFVSEYMRRENDE